MKKYKTNALRLLCFVLTFLVVFSMAACGTNDQNVQKQQTDTVGGYGHTSTKNYSEGLEFELSSDGTYYTVVGIGACTDSHIVIPSAVGGIPVTHIGDKALYKAEMTQLTIPNSITYIGIDAFNDCNSLTEIVIPDSVTIIEDYAFGGCDYLEKVELSANLTRLGEGAFTGCRSLKNLVIPEGISHLYAIRSCFTLASIELPSTLTYIQSSAFMECSMLRTIYYNGTTAQWENIDKGLYWNNLTPGQEVICTDGVVTENNY